MLRNRSRAVNTTQSFMADPPSLPNSQAQAQAQTPNQTKPKSLLQSPRLLMGFSPKIFSEKDSIMSPTSILDTKHLSFISSSPLFSNTNQKKDKPTCLGLVDVLDHDDEQNHMFSPKFKIQIPSLEGNFPIEFGVKNRETMLALLSPRGRYPLTKQNVSVIENDKSEEYTCVISHGPNPKTTHIFDDRVINGDLGNSELNELLSYCHTCKKKKKNEERAIDSRNDEAICKCENKEAR